MRYLLAAAVCAAALFVNVAAQAEKRTFIIANNADGYGVDRCLATGATCGVAVATAYCQSRDYAQAAGFEDLTILPTEDFGFWRFYELLGRRSDAA